MPLCYQWEMQVPPFFLAGELAALCAAFVWSGSLTAFRFYGAGFPAKEANLFKNSIAFGCLALVLVVTGAVWPARGDTWAWLALSGFIGIAVGDTAFFAALSRLSAQLTSVSQCLSPVTAAIFAWAWLGEGLGWNEIAGITLTLTAVAGAILLGGHASQFRKPEFVAGLAFALLSAVSNGAGIVIARSAFQEVDAVTGTFIRVGASLLILVPQCFLQRSPGFTYRSLFRTRSKGIGLTLSAFSGAFLGLLLMSVGIKYAKAGVAAALSLTYPIWILPLSRIFLGEKASIAAILCIVLAVLGVALMFYR